MSRIVLTPVEAQLVRVAEELTMRPARERFAALVQPILTARGVTQGRIEGDGDDVVLITPNADCADGCEVAPV